MVSGLKLRRLVAKWSVGMTSYKRFVVEKPLTVAHNYCGGLVAFREVRVGCRFIGSVYNYIVIYVLEQARSGSIYIKSLHDTLPLVNRGLPDAPNRFVFGRCAGFVETWE
jgi:hypothetical protein